MKKILMTALVATTLFACSNQDESPLDNGATKTLKLSINAGGFTRAAGPAVANGAKTTISSLYVYFVDNANPEAGGAVVLGSTALGTTEIAAAQTATGHEITGVNSAAKSVYVIANYTENGISLGDNAGTSIASIQQKVATMGAVSGTNNTTDWQKAVLSNAPRSGVTNNGLIGAVVNNKAEVSVSIMPALSRVEIGTISADPDAANNLKVTGFDLKGVYLNGFYPQFNLKGEAKGTAHAISTATATAITEVATTYPWFCDVYGTPLTSATTYSAGGGNVWAYMLPASAPRIIFDIDNVTYQGGTPTTQDMFVTVKSFTYSAAGTTPSGTVYAANDPVVFERGCIYKVNTVLFDLGKIHENPNAENIDVTVKVTVLGWAGIEVNPIL